jgi:predicted GH43/DUF377 family glycosyl hydrolase
MKLIRPGLKLIADPQKVLLLPFSPGSEKRIYNILNRILAFSESETQYIYEDIIKKFQHRHLKFEDRLLENYSLVKKYVSGITTHKQEIVIGAYFSKEYSIESAALFNPSIVPHPDQSELNKGELRFLISLRATGEGHISSIEFLTGLLSQSGNIILDSKSKFAVPPSWRDTNPVLSHVVEEDKLGSNYDIVFSGDEKLTERVIFPYAKTECNGIEDVRFVKFGNENGDSVYYGTFTAYDGFRILSCLIETNDFRKFKVRTLAGNGIKDKGMALFPEKINGNYWMISRQDGENIFIMNSGDIYEWNNPVILKKPKYAWESVQVGNCGSPIKTNEGWLLLTHAVGPLRSYVMSALLLDLNDPGKIIGHLKDPLIFPNEDERDGYVPNVVYSCGSMIHAGNLIIPYAMSDSATSFATIPVSDLVNMMQ